MNERSGEIEALLALGFDRRRAVRNISAQALRLALLPQIESTRSVGMVFLPGHSPASSWPGWTPSTPPLSKWPSCF
ncbi:MAG TPA: hypothetical protein EYG34_05005 [Acidimicrobiia bacterium]|nr:hypothetical protein [Acidimicrobiia bacterium]